MEGDYQEPKVEMKEDSQGLGQKIDWKQIELRAIDRVGGLIKEDLVKWALSVDYLEAILPELTDNEEYQKQLTAKVAECAKTHDDGERIKKLYTWKFATIVRMIRKKEPLELIGTL